jgi:hypothetical protein
MAYQVGNIPSDAPAWLVQELRKLQSEWQAPQDFLQLNPVDRAPKKPRAGMIVEAIGTNWKPDGVGGGCFIYRAGAWVKLG